MDKQIFVTFHAIAEISRWIKNFQCRYSPQVETEYASSSFHDE